MRTLKYYVLGKKNNQILKKYKKNYDILIQKKLEEISKFLQQDLSNITINSDSSSIINKIYEGDNSQEIMNELKKIIDHKQKKDFIPGTTIELTTDFINPYSVHDTHPEHKNDGKMIGYGELSKKQWLEEYSKAFSLLKDLDEGFYDEINYLVEKIIPLGTAESMHNSSSYKGCIGHIYLGFDTNGENTVIKNLEAIIHETSHNKLNLIMHFDPLIYGTPEENYYSPYRPDARPIFGVFLGIHAFIPTIYTLIKAVKREIITDEKIIFKLISYHLKNKIGFNVAKKYGKFTPLGKEIMGEISYSISITDKLISTLKISDEIKNEAKKNVKNHLIKTKKNFPHLLY